MSKAVDALMSTAVTSTDEHRAELRALYVEHADALHSGLRRLTWPGCDVDDLLQEVFIVALRRPRQALLAESPKAWLYGVAVKVAAGARRRHRLRRFLGMDAAANVAAAGGQEARDVAASVHAALGRMAAKKREVLVLYELQGLSGEEIANVLGVPLKTVWSRLHYAREEFQRVMVRHG
jgi:RNA polymerase sigma-70 factor (ECF subfamily)